MLPVFLLSPHYDDAALSASITIETLAGLSTDVTIVNCFTISEWGPRAPGLNCAEMSALRRDEDREFLEKLGHRVRSIDLDRQDAQLRLRCAVRDIRRPRPLGRKDVAHAKELAAALPNVSNAAILMPLGLGDHIDHRVAREAGMFAWGTSPLLGFYEELPYATEIPDSCIGPAIHSLSRRLKTSLVPVLTRNNTVDKNGWDRKRELISVYRSQLADFQIAQAVKYGQSLGGERLWVTRELRDYFCEASYDFRPVARHASVVYEVASCAVRRKWKQTCHMVRRIGEVIA